MCNYIVAGMNIIDTRWAVETGRCTWLHLYETLINAGTSHYTRRQILAGKLEVEPAVDLMLQRLFPTSEVPALRRGDPREVEARRG